MADYAAKYWLLHAKYGSVADREDIQLGMEHLFAQEYTFASWVWLHDIDNPTRETMPTESPEKPATPPIYAMLCRLPTIVKYLAWKFPESVNNKGAIMEPPCMRSRRRVISTQCMFCWNVVLILATWASNHQTVSQECRRSPWHQGVNVRMGKGARATSASVGCECEVWGERAGYGDGFLASV